MLLLLPLFEACQYLFLAFLFEFGERVRTVERIAVAFLE